MTANLQEAPASIRVFTYANTPGPVYRAQPDGLIFVTTPIPASGSTRPLAQTDEVGQWVTVEMLEAIRDSRVMVETSEPFDAFRPEESADTVEKYRHYASKLRKLAKDQPWAAVSHRQGADWWDSQAEQMAAELPS